jgi:hypothetical protein
VVADKHLAVNRLAKFTTAAFGVMLSDRSVATSADMDDVERTIEITRLQSERAEAEARQKALLREAEEWYARIHEIRAAFGNPFFYSNPEHPDEGRSNYTGARSHDVVLPTLLALQDVHRRLRAIGERLRELEGASE